MIVISISGRPEGRTLTEKRAGSDRVAQIGDDVMLINGVLVDGQQVLKDVGGRQRFFGSGPFLTSIGRRGARVLFQ